MPLLKWTSNDDFGVQWSGVFRPARYINGLKGIVGKVQLCLTFNSPRTAFVPRASLAGNNTTINNTVYQDGAIFRKAFQNILKDSEEYQNSDMSQLDIDGTRLPNIGTLQTPFLLLILFVPPLG